MMIFLNIILVFVAWYFFVSAVFSQEIKSAQERDPAAKGNFQIIFLYCGLHAIIAIGSRIFCGGTQFLFCRG